MCQIESNADVTGKGIRISIYILCLASGVLTILMRYTVDAKILEDFVRAHNSALQIQGLALLCTAIYQTFRNQLTLFHAICVLHLLSLLGLGLAARGNYGHKGRYRRSVLWAAKGLISAAFVSFLGYVWAIAPRFGSQPECNATTLYVVFWVNIKAINKVFRYVILTFMVLAVLLIVMNSLLLGLVAACCCGVRGGRTALSTVDGAAIITVVARGAQIKEPRVKWVALQRNLGEGIVRTLINVYGIVMLELTVHRNNLSPEERGWTFGQILAIFLLLGVAAEVLNALLVKLDAKRKEAKPDEESFPQQSTMAIEETRCS